VFVENRMRQVLAGPRERRRHRARGDSLSRLRYSERGPDRGEVRGGRGLVAGDAHPVGVHPTQVGGWKKQALAGLPDIFGNGREQMRQQADTEKDELYKQIGQLKVELDFLKKRAGLID